MSRHLRAFPFPDLHKPFPRCRLRPPLYMEGACLPRNQRGRLVRERAVGIPSLTQMHPGGAGEDSTEVAEAWTGEDEEDQIMRKGLLEVTPNRDRSKDRHRINRT